MGPSKKGSTKGKGALAAVSRARTPRIPVATTAEESRAAAGSSQTEAPANEDGFPSHWFQSEADFFKYSSFSNREVLLGREIDFPFLESVNFTYLGKFHSFGWMKLLGLSRNYCEKVVRHFYANAELIEPEVGYFKTFIKGVAFEVDDKLLSGLYGIPTGGEFYGETFNRLEACRVVFRNEAMAQPSRDVSLLDRDMRLLHLIIIHVLKPRAGKLSSLTNEDTWMMWKIALGQRIDLGDLIASEMIECRNKPELRLFYGRLITDMVIKLGADLKEEKLTYMHPNTRIGAGSLVKARFKLVDGIWTKPGVEVEDEEVEGAAHSLPSSLADWGEFMTDFWTFQANVLDNLSELRAQNQELMARKDNLDEMIKNLQDSEDDD
ncbi:hypothetical protein Fot_00360 [Forsythia ovata]|uniref:Putative plant transposon protein domain-containing protein n=1 Tax=Forsythia ovata TaxID=205694 RepID=A0ABD1X1C7_9LAMI